MPTPAWSRYQAPRRHRRPERRGRLTGPRRSGPGRLLVLFLLLLVVLLLLLLGPLDHHHGHALFLAGEGLGPRLVGLRPAEGDRIALHLVDALDGLPRLGAVGVRAIDFLGLLVGVDHVGPLGLLVAELEGPLLVVLLDRHLLQFIRRRLQAVPLERDDGELAGHRLELLLLLVSQFDLFLVVLLVVLLLVLLVLLL